MNTVASPDTPEREMKALKPLAVFDSGIGGLSVVRHIRATLPHENIIYFADQAHIPYGGRSRAEITGFVTAITRFLLGEEAKALVVACNTASAAALNTLRQTFPQIPIVGMEPAIKPAAAATRSGRVGVLATEGTFNSSRYASLMSRFAPNLDVYEDPCPGLVQQIEAGELNTPTTEAILRRAVTPMLNAEVDVLVLGCTHYPFILPLLRTIVGDRAVILDPAPAVARQTANVLQHHKLAAPGSQDGSFRCLTTGDAYRLSQMSSQLLAYSCPAEAVVWQGDRIVRQ